MELAEICWCENCAKQPRETWTMKHRHECEVRYVAGLASNDARASYLFGVRAKRGEEAAARLRLAAWEILKP